MQMSPVQGFSSCGLYFCQHAQQASGVALLSASGASGNGRIVFGSAWPAGGFSGSLQQSNELNIYPDYVLHALTNSIVRLYLSLNGKRKSSDLAT